MESVCRTGALRFFFLADWDCCGILDRSWFLRVLISILFSLLSGTKLLGETGCAGWRVELLLARRWLQRFCCGGQKFGG
jgi:hypothetical protein